METDEEAFDLYNSRMAIPDAIFDTDTDITLIPGFREGKLPRHIINICTKYAAGFKKSLMAGKRTKFEPATLPLIDGSSHQGEPQAAARHPFIGRASWTTCLTPSWRPT